MTPNCGVAEGAAGWFAGKGWNWAARGDTSGRRPGQVTVSAMRRVIESSELASRCFMVPRDQGRNRSASGRDIADGFFVPRE